MSKANLQTQEKEENIPYYTSQEALGVLIKLDNKEIFANLDFANNTTSLIFENSAFLALKNEFNIDYYLTISFETLEEMIDSLGGIELSLNNENLSYTGNQITALLKERQDGELLVQISEEICRKIAESTINETVIQNLLANSEGTFLLKDYYLYSDSLNKVFQNVRIIY